MNNKYKINEIFRKEIAELKMMFSAIVLSAFVVGVVYGGAKVLDSFFHFETMSDAIGYSATLFLFLLLDIVFIAFIVMFSVAHIYPKIKRYKFSKLPTTKEELDKYGIKDLNDYADYVEKIFSGNKMLEKILIRFDSLYLLFETDLIPGFMRDDFSYLMFKEFNLEETVVIISGALPKGTHIIEDSNVLIISHGLYKDYYDLNNKDHRNMNILRSCPVRMRFYENGTTIGEYPKMSVVKAYAKRGGGLIENTGEV